MTEQLDTPAGGSLVFDGPKGPLFKALAEAQKHYLPLTKDEEADVKLKAGGGYKHAYASLAHVIGCLKPGWESAGIAVSQPSDGYFLYTIVAVGDSSMTVAMQLPEWHGPQDLGSLLAYFRRYQLKGVFSVNDSDDDDGNAATGNQASFTRRQPNTPKSSGPNVPKEVIDEVFAAGKEKGLGKQEFHARAKAVCGKEWLEFNEGDAKKLLADLVMK